MAPPAAFASWSAIESALDLQGKELPGGVLKFDVPRSDLNVTLDGVRLSPALAIGGWLAFTNTTGGNVLLLGDLPLTLAEVGPVMAKLREGGISTTALHNHILGESPRIMFLHLEGTGDGNHLAAALHAAIALTGAPHHAPTSAPTNQTGALDTARLDAIMGMHGKPKADVYQFLASRADPVTMDDMQVPPSMGLQTTLNFQPTGNGTAAATGDFVLTVSEVNDVVAALQSHGINVTALHNHMMPTGPALFFVHFFAHDDATRIAEGLRAALDHVKIAA